MRWLLVALVGGLLISCERSGGQTGTGGGGGLSGGGSGGLSDGGGGTGGSDAGAGPGPASGMSVRFINTFLPTGTTGPALDLYDATEIPYGDGAVVVNPVTRLVTGLAYGAVSDYVAPHFAAAGSTAIFLAALPAGSPPTGATDAIEVWSAVDDGSHAQVTLLLENFGPGTSQDALAGIGSAIFVEKGDDGAGNAGPLAPPSSTGGAEFLASTAPIDVTAAPPASYYFFVDEACNPPLNGDPSQPSVPYLFALPTATPKSFFALFPSRPGTHQVSVVAWTDGLLPTCAELTARQGATSVNLTAGQQILAFVYGSSLTDLHLVTAPVAP
jgi:hypothetical protein